MKLTLIFATFIYLLIAGCSSNKPKSPEFRENFTTMILTDDTKMFDYALVAKMPEQGGRRRGKGGRGRGKGGMGGGPDGGGPRRGKDRGDFDDKRAEIEAKLKAELEDRLIVKLNQTGFCREGYITIEELSQMNAVALRGQCNEPATVNDREMFPNPVAKKVIEERLD